MTAAARGRAWEALKVRLIVFVGAWLVRLLAATWRVRHVRRELWDAAHSGDRRVVLVLWHGQLLPLLVLHRNYGIAVLISEHRDGEIIARIAERYGFGTVRGSTTRGAGRALIGLARALEEGRPVAVTPDGPRGPVRTFAPGAVVAAQRAGAPILPLSAAADRAWRLRSWDRFLIPKPFARVTVAYGEPTLVRATSARDAAGEAPRFQAILDALTAEAET